MRNSRNRLLAVAVCIAATLLLCSLGQVVARPGQHRSPAVTRNRITNGQQESLVDYFPLAVGNFWKYQFGDTTTIVEVQQYEADFGTVEFTIIGVSPQADALTVWHLIRRRTYLKVWYDNGGAWRQATVRDSTGFDLSESMSGQHSLQTPTVDMHNLFSFPPRYSDSTSFLRYRERPLFRLSTRLCKELAGSCRGRRYNKLITLQCRCVFLTYRSEV